MNFIFNHISEIVSFIGGLIGGSLLTIKITGHRTGKRGTVTDQSKARAGGDIVGGNKTTR